MKKGLTWILRFIPWALALGVPLFWDQITGVPWTEWVKTQTPLAVWQAVLLLVLAALGLTLLVGGITTKLEKRAAWNAWREAFRYIGPALHTDAQAIVGPTREMGQTFVDRPRALAAPPTLQSPRDGTLLATDAAAFLRDQILGPGRLGLLLQGRPLLGKTRFLVEWLRREHPDLYVLAPDSGQDLPAPHDDLARHLTHGACLFLDDLDTFAERMPQVLALLDTLRALTTERGVPVLVLATVRDGGPGATVDNDPAFRPLREGLTRVEIQPPTDAHMDAVAEQVDPDPLPPGEREQSFAFVLETQFEVQRERYARLQQSEATRDRAALRWLQAAKLLDDRGISLKRDRVEAVAAALFQHAPEDTEAGLLVLRQQGFRDDRVLEPSFLKNVARDFTADRPGLADDLETLLRDRTDAEALFEWGVALAIQGRDLVHAERLLRDAADAGRASGTPEGLAQVAIAQYNLGVLLNQEGDPDGARAS